LVRIVTFLQEEMEGIAMNLERLARSGLKRAADRIAWTWIAAAPLVVLLGASAGVVEIRGPRAFAADEPTATRCPELCDEKIDLSKVGSGELLLKTPDDGHVPLPMVDLDVRLEVTGMMLHGTLVQSFVNPTADVIEAIYVFPLPERAAVHHMEMQIGPRRIVSTIQEREQAKKTYTTAKKEGRKAALVEQERPNLFTTSAANINPGESIDVTLEYLQELDYDDGEFGLSFPLTFTPRFTPGFTPPSDPGLGVAGGISPETVALPDAARVSPPFMPAGAAEPPRARIHAEIHTGFPIDEIECVSHDIRSWWEGGTLVVAPTVERVVADRDFRLSWRPLVGSEPRSALFVEDREDGRYALMMLLPPLEQVDTGRGLPTETLFIVDVSGSMAGPSLDHAKEALLAALDRLRPEDTFNIIRFSDHTVPFRSGFVPAHGDDLDEARCWVSGLATEGGTMIYPALRTGLDMLKASETDRVQRMIFLTDGAISNEVRIFQSIVGELGPVRLHTLGIGFAPNAYLMRKMASFGGGLCDFISDASTAENRIDAFFARLDRPVLTDLELTWDGAEPLEVYPQRLTDLHTGQPIFISARLPAGAGAVGAELAGRTVAGDVGLSMQVNRPAPTDSGVATRWARAKVGSLMDSLHEGADPESVRQSVVNVSLAFHIVTRYTSLVAVEEFTSAFDPARPFQVANALPKGSQLMGVLPQGSTHGPLLLFVGVILAVAGAAFLWGAWKWS
jgi:Ca-activated chloride channel family protein